MAAHTGLVYVPSIEWVHESDHPESPERLQTTWEAFNRSGILNRASIELIKAQPAGRDSVEAVHVCLPDFDSIATECPRMAAGALLTLADARMSGRVSNGFALIRPPGHHANRITLGTRGFCVLNNIAILVQHLRIKHHLRRIAIIDTDVHHGDGTQSIFWNDPDLLFISIHQDGRTLYPGTGFPEETGGPAARSTKINLPLLPGTGDDEVLRLVNEIVVPAVESFKPEIVLNSAGQDGHFSDPLAGLCLTARGYAEITRRIKPDLVVLEGGYSYDGGLPYAHLGILSALCGIETDSLAEPGRDGLHLSENPKIHARIEHLIRFFTTSPPISLTDAGTGTHSESESRSVILYDQPNLYDHRIERYNSCKNCSGKLTIHSQATLLHRRECSSRIHVIPFDGCPDCKDAAYREAGNEPLRDRGRIDRVIVQDMRTGVVDTLRAIPME